MPTLFQTVIGELAAAFTSDTCTSTGATFYKLKPDAQRWCSRSELAYREGLHGGGDHCRACGGEHCPHYACTTSGGMGYCDNCTGDDDV